MGCINDKDHDPDASVYSVQATLKYGQRPIDYTSSVVRRAHLPARKVNKIKRSYTEEVDSSVDNNVSNNHSTHDTSGGSSSGDSGGSS